MDSKKTFEETAKTLENAAASYKEKAVEAVKAAEANSASNPFAMSFVKTMAVGVVGYFLGKRVGRCEGALVTMAGIVESMSESMAKGE